MKKVIRPSEPLAPEATHIDYFVAGFMAGMPDSVVLEFYEGYSEDLTSAQYGKIEKLEAEWWGRLVDAVIKAGLDAEEGLRGISLWDLLPEYEDSAEDAAEPNGDGLAFSCEACDGPGPVNEDGLCAACQALAAKSHD